MDDDRRRKSRGRPEYHGSPLKGRSSPTRPPLTPTKKSPSKQSPKGSPEGGAAGGAALGSPYVASSMGGAVEGAAGGAVGGEAGYVPHSPGRPVSSYWLERHQAGHNAQHRRTCSNPEQGYPTQLQLSGYSTARRLPISPSKPAGQSYWALPSASASKPDSKATFLDSYPRNTEEVPYRQRNILRPLKAEKPTSTRPKARARRRSTGNSQAAAVSRSQSKEDEDEISWDHFRQVKELDVKKHWKEKPKSGPHPTHPRAWSNTSDAIYLARHEGSLNTHLEVDYFPEDSPESESESSESENVAEDEETDIN